MELTVKIEQTLSDIIQNIWLMNCPEQRPPDEYVVYNPEIDVPDNFGDNEPGSWIHHVQIHYFTKKNYVKKRKNIRKALHGAGFLISEIETMYEKDSEYYHLCFSCSVHEDLEE